MQKKPRKSQFLYLAGPLLIQWGISIVVATVAEAAYALANYPRILNVMESQEEMMNLVYAMSEEILQYNTEITTLAAIMTIPLMWYFFHQDRKEDIQLGRAVEKQGSVPQYLAVGVLGICICFAANNIMMLMNLSAYSETYQKTAASLYQSPFLMQIIGLGIIVPIMEELVYRGLLFKRMRVNLPRKMAIIGSAVIFGAFHGNLVQFVYATVLGMFLAFVYEKFQSVFVPMLLHMAVNLTSVIATKLNLFEWMFADIMRVGIVTVITAGIAAGMYVIIMNIPYKLPDLTVNNKNCA